MDTERVGNIEEFLLAKETYASKLGSFEDTQLFSLVTHRSKEDSAQFETVWSSILVILKMIILSVELEYIKLCMHRVYHSDHSRKLSDWV